MSALLVRLRQETQLLHQQTEELFYAGSLREGTLSARAYGHLLCTHLVFHQALEEALSSFPDFFLTYAPQTRQKTPWLLADLMSLPEALPAPLPVLFSDWSAVELLGALYVAEGSMLGGAVINRMLHQNKELQPLLASTRFYQGYGAETGHQWQQCREFITRQGTAHADEVVASARRAFMAYQTAFFHSQTRVADGQPKV